MRNERRLDLVVLSDLHLGSYGCHADELVAYLKSIRPNILILNGDLVDIWQFKKNYWPDSHMKVLKCLMSMLTHGTTIYYVTGNHDEMLRKYSPFRLGHFHLVDKLVLDIDGKKAWIFHGDVFDVTMKYSKWIAKLGSKGYDLLIRLNKLINYFSMQAGRGRMSFSRRIKDSVKIAVKFISNFELTATGLAIEKQYQYVICGHIHRPNIEVFSNERGTVTYMNSGDWVENLTALEYNDRKWSIYRHPVNHSKQGSNGSSGDKGVHQNKDAHQNGKSTPFASGSPECDIFEVMAKEELQAGSETFEIDPDQTISNGIKDNPLQWNSNKNTREHLEVLAIYHDLIQGSAIKQTE